MLCVGKVWAITVGKWYNVIGEDKNQYKVIDDQGRSPWWRKVYFKTQQEVRVEKFKELGL